MIFDEKFFKKFDYTAKQVDKFLESAIKDLNIAGQADNVDVKFQFAYNALIKLGIALIAGHKFKVSSRAGHHIKIIEKIAQILNREDVVEIGNKMRRNRNYDLYGGGSFISDKQTFEYYEFISELFKKAKEFFKHKLGRML